METNEEVVAKHLKLIIEDFEQGPQKDNFVIFTASEDKNIYIQFMAFSGDTTLNAEAVSNGFLKEGTVLQSEQISQLKSLRWKPPSNRHVNYHRVWDICDESDLVQIANEVMFIFHEVYKVPLEFALKVNFFSN